MSDMDSLVEEFGKRFEKVLEESNKRMELANAEYTATLANAQKDFQELLTASEAQTETVKSEADTKAKVPAAAWINAPDGEEMMVLNREAVVMFLAIFERIGEIASMIQKSKS